MAVVLPQGRFNNASDKDLRDYLAAHCRILTVVGLHGNVFKPHTGTKTSVLFVQKWNDDPDAGPLCPRKADYPIFFATMREPSKDNSGDKIYRAIRHSMTAAEVAEIEELKTKWQEIRERERQLLFKQKSNDISDEESSELQQIVHLRESSVDEIAKAEIDLNAPLLDSHGHLIVKHDLFNHDGVTEDGIAEAFIEFAKKEDLSFFL